jgi:DHA1 family inner membrane transport protein
MSRDNKLLAISLFLWGIGEGLSLYIQPLYLKELGADPLAIGSVLALAGLGMGLAHIPAGYLADRFGRKQLMLAGWGFGAVAMRGMYLARDLQVFAVALVAYTFTGFVLAPITAYATAARGGQSVQRALSLVFAGFWAGTVISPALGGWIGQAFGLRTVYGLGAAIFVASTGVLWQAGSQPLSAPASGKTRYGPLFRNRRFLGFLGLIVLALGVMELGLPFAANFVTEVRGLDVGTVGLLGSINSLGVVFANVFLGHLRPRWGFLLGQVMLAASLAVLLFTGGVGWIACAFFLRAGWNLAISMALAQVGRVVDKPEMGLAYGLTETAFSVATTLGPLAAGALYEQARPLPFQASLGLILLAVPLVWWLAPRQDAHTAEDHLAPAIEAE